MKDSGERKLSTECKDGEITESMAQQSGPDQKTRKSTRGFHLRNSLLDLTQLLS